MKCSNCGHENKNSAIFCMKCGCLLKTEKKNNHHIVIVIGMLILMIAVAMLLLIKKKAGHSARLKETTVENTKTETGYTETTAEESTDFQESVDSEKVEENNDDLNCSALDDNGEANSNVDPSGIPEDIENIREMYNEMEENMDSYIQSDAEGGSCYTSPDGIYRVYVSSDDFQGYDTAADYERFFYVKNNQLFFVFYRNNSEEQRFYFKNDTMIQWIDEKHITHDFSERDSSQWSEWSILVNDDYWEIAGMGI